MHEDDHKRQQVRVKQIPVAGEIIPIKIIAKTPMAKLHLRENILTQEKDDEPRYWYG